jgi:hypothetical protein
MKALSVRQPWAWAIFNAGKDIENRDWQNAGPHMRQVRTMIGQRFLIHASGGMTKMEHEEFSDFVTGSNLAKAVPSIEQLERGGIVGSVILERIISPTDGGETNSPWFFGPVGLVLSQPEPMEFIPMKGRQGWFEVSL